MMSTTATRFLIRCQISTQPCHKSVSASAIACLCSASSARKVSGLSLSSRVDFACRGMYGKGCSRIITFSSQVGGLEDLSKLFVQPRHEGVKDPTISFLCSAISFRKIVRIGYSSHVDFTRGGMNGKGSGIIFITSSKIGGLEYFG